MKKILLSTMTLLLGIGFSVTAQQSVKHSRLNGIVNKKAYTLNKALPKVDENFVLPAGSSNAPLKLKSNASSLFVPTDLGETFYDLQTNASVGRRIINHADGTISAVWTIAPDASPYNARGTGWNYFNGTTWGPYVSTRLETVRTGFGQIGLLGNGKEVIMAHLGPPYGFTLGTNTTKGSSTWSFGAVPSATAPLPTTNNNSLWARIATGGSDGNSIHLISSYFDTVQLINGVKRPTVYSRSQNAGVTWDIVSVALPGYNSTRYLFGDAENYSIDAQGTTVAIAIADFGGDVALWKSADNGTTFTKTYIDSSFYAPDYFTNPSTPLDSAIPTNDGSISVVLDATNKVHVAYASSFVQKNSAGGASFFPTTVDLIYWNDVTKLRKSIDISIANIDQNLNGLYDVGGATTNFDGTTGPAARYGSGSYLSKPSIATDATGNNVFIIFSLVNDADSLPNGQSFRDIWVVASQDGGTTWGCVQNLTCSFAQEEAFACVAKRVDANLHVLYQYDLEPGTALQNTDPDGPNTIKYEKYSVASILAGTASCITAPCIVGINAQDNSGEFTVTSNYPNPFSGTTEFNINLVKPADVSVEVVNVLGETVIPAAAKKYGTGTHTISINASNLSSGVYFYTVKAGEFNVTKKMLVK